MVIPTDVNRILAQMTLAEKVSLVSGADGWQTQEVARLGIGSLKTTDGPAGARGKLSVGGSQAVFLPAPAGQAATWSRADVRAIGRVLSREAETKAAQVLLAPTVCCVRNPLGGRNFESFSEDPFLSGALALEYVAGLQEKGNVVAAAKHFVANEQEFERFTINANISEKALREIYLRPFEMIVKGPSPPGCLMTSYNSVNGLHADMNCVLIQDILRGEWKYEGLVMSDWGGTNSTVESLIAGCDLEMPGPSDRRGEKLLKMIESDENGALAVALAQSSGRVLSLLERMGLLGLSESAAKASRTAEEKSSTAATDLQTVCDVVANGTVLLKNSWNVLPLLPHQISGKTITFIGPNARIGAAGGGGSASMNPQYQSHPMDAFKKRTAQCGVDVQVEYSIGAYSHKWLPLVTRDRWTVATNTGPDSVLRLEFFDAPDCGGSLVETQYRTESLMDLFDTAPLALQGTSRVYSFRMTSTVTPGTTGRHAFGITSIGNSRLFVDQTLLVDNYHWKEPGESFYSFGSSEARQSMDMVAGQTYHVVLESSSKDYMDVSSQNNAGETIENPFGTQPSVRLGFLEQPSGSLISDALELANRSDFTVLVVGLNEEWESEGFDRQTMELPGSQIELITALLSGMTQPSNLIIVNQSGSPVEMAWCDEAGTIIQAWYGGQEAGHALADVLLGLKPPSGRLPMTWPRRYPDLPFATDPESWPGVSGQVYYKEGVEVGYRWYLRQHVQPQWWFGYGLSYTTFLVSNLHMTMTQGGLILHVTVNNEGTFAGQEVIQVYCWPAELPERRELVSFQKTSLLQPGCEQVIELDVQFRDMAHWDCGHWLLEKGTYVLGICDHAGGLAIVRQDVSIPSSLKWDP
ncbi:glycoside hydrolase superfamily [Aspergillus cavernicola]|uniref:beta-glucosidase n=1 Tax=Aspergillus cavernicola TaxID=176166 RepID=A0ABR4J5H9_9EURO